MFWIQTQDDLDTNKIISNVTIPLKILINIILVASKISQFGLTVLFYFFYSLICLDIIDNLI